MRSLRLRPLVSRLLIYTHRWFGILLGVLFAGWFVSGVVLMYAGMPRLDPAERLARRPSLNFSRAMVAPSDVARAAGGQAEGLQLTTVAGRPVYKLRVHGRTVAFYADDGQAVAPFSVEDALNEARAFAPGDASTIHFEQTLTAPDQWTLEINRQLPMHRVALGDQDGSRIYISASSGDVVLKTTAAARRWAYPGAILHWIYLTPIRAHGEAWAQFIIWTSLAGTVMCIVGLAWGVWRYSPLSHYRLKRVRSHSPYAGWMWWHHYAGLVFGLFTITWVFSGLLSMDPWDWHPSTSATAEQRQAFAGDTAASIDHLSVDDLRRALSQVAGAREAEVVRSQGRMWLASDRGVVPLSEGTGHLPLDADSVRGLADRAMPGTGITEIATLNDYDSYYYDRDRELPLPVLRLSYGDPQHTSLYVDPARGVILRKEERLTRLNRWLYHGLHSLDFPFLYYRRPLWDVIVIALSLGGLALTLVAVAPAWHRLRRHARHFLTAPSERAPRS